MADIAYIDDNMDCLEIVKTAFNELGLSLDIYDDPVQFYNTKKQYKLIISDFYMPDINGQDFIKLIKEKDPRVKTILYTGAIEEIKDLIEMRAEFDSFLQKPLDFESLTKVVKFLLYEYDNQNRSFV